MKKIQILLVKKDSLKVDKIKTYLERKNNFKVIAVATSLQEALRIFFSVKDEINIVLIDIFLRENPDILFAKAIIRNKKKPLPLIFMANLDTYATPKLIHSKTNNYFLNPLNQIELTNALELALDKLAEKPSVLSSKSHSSVYPDKPLFIKKNNVLIKVFEKDIHFVTVEGRYSKILTTDEDFLVQLSLKQFLEISSSKFIRTHRNYVVNFDKIKKVFLLDNLIQLKNGMKIDISRQYKQKFIHSYEILV